MVTTVDKYVNVLKENHKFFKKKRNVTREQFEEYVGQQTHAASALLAALLNTRKYQVEIDLSVAINSAKPSGDMRTKRKILAEELDRIGVKEASMSYKAIMYVFDHEDELAALDLNAAQEELAKAMKVKKNVLAAALSGVVKKCAKATDNTYVLTSQISSRHELIDNVLLFSGTCTRR